MKLFLFTLTIFSTIQLVYPTSKSFAQTYLDTAGLSPFTHYKTFETEHFRMIYQEGYFDFTERAAVHLEHAHEVLSPILKWQPRYKTDILVADNEDAANGFTSPALRIGIALIATPPDAYFSTSYTDDWIKLLVFHEYTHMLNIDPTRGLMEAARIFFGDIIRPNGLWPIWQLEGLAVYFETRTSLLGRGRSPYYDSIIRAYLNEGRLGTHEDRGITLDRMNGIYPYFPSGEIPYLFGYHMWNQFSKDHLLFKDTDEAMGELSYRSSYRIPYFIEGNLENVMNKNWSSYWESFVNESSTRLGKQIEQVKASGESHAELLTNSQYTSMMGAISPDGEWLAYSESSLDDVSILAMINLRTKETRRLEEKTLGVGMSFTPDSKHLIYSSLKRTHTYSLFSELSVYDLVLNQSYLLSAGLRGKDPSLSSEGDMAVFVVSEKATHVLRTAHLIFENGRYALTNVKTVYTPKPFTMLSMPRYINDNEIIFSKQEIGQAQSDLAVLSLHSENVKTILADGAMNRAPMPKDGKIYFISDRSGIDNVYALNANDHEVKSLTNVVTGTSQPFIASDGILYASVMTSDGYEIGRFDRVYERSLIDKISAPSAPESLPEALKEPTLKFDESLAHDYSPWSSLAPRQWAPISALTYNTYAGLSMFGTILGFDPTGKHQYFGYGGYNFKTATVDGQFQYTYYGILPNITFAASSLTANIGDDFYHQEYRNASQVALSLSYPIRWTYSSLVPSLYGFVNWNRVYSLTTGQKLRRADFEYANPLVPGLGVALNFSDAETTRLGFMKEEGNDVRVAAEDRISTVDQFSVIKYVASYAHYFGLGNHSVIEPKFRYLGSTHPTGFDHSYARVQGRYGYDIYDRGQQLNLDRIGVRGYTEATLYSRQAMVASVDFHFALARPFFGDDTLPFFIKQVHGFVFAETAFISSVYFPRASNLYLPSFGGGISVDTTLLIRLPVTFNLEVQNGTRTDFGGDTQLFLSLTGSPLF